MAQDTSDLAAGIRSGIEAMPFNRLLGIRIKSMQGGRAQGVLDERADLSNHAGTVHVGAQYALIEATGGAAVSSALLDLLDSAVPLEVGAEVAYRRPARGTVVADAAVAEGDAERVRQELEAQGSSRLQVAVTLTDAQGAMAMDATLRWTVKKR